MPGPSGNSAQPLLFAARGKYAGRQNVAHETRKTGILDFVTNSAHERAAHYREHAAKLREMAEKESAGRLRTNLLSLADQYEGLAAKAAIKPTE